MIFVKQLTGTSYLGEQHHPWSCHTEQGPGGQQCAELCQDRGRRERTDPQEEGPGVAAVLPVDLKSGPEGECWHQGLRSAHILLLSSPGVRQAFLRLRVRYS